MFIERGEGEKYYRTRTETARWGIIREDISERMGSERDRLSKRDKDKVRKRDRG